LIHFIKQRIAESRQSLCVYVRERESVCRRESHRDIKAHRCKDKEAQKQRKK